MTAVSQPGARRRLTRPPLPLIIAAVLVLTVISIFGARFVASRGAGPLAGASVATVTLGPLVASINATGEVEPLQRSELAFAAREGRVAAVLVSEGDVVAANDPLVRLETRQLDAEVASAAAALAQAQADLQGLLDGATEAEIAAARAQVDAARGALRQVQGSVTEADIRAAEQRVVEARARLATLEGAPNPDALTQAEAALAQAQANLDRQRSELSAAKEQARRAVEARANDLRDAQATYAQALRDQQRALDDDRDPVTGAPLTDSGRESYINALAAAERAMQDADEALAQARVEYENARQSEISGLADAEARVERAQADLNALLNPNPDDLAAARAELAAAEARLAQLTGEQQAGALQAQRANLTAAEANLEALLADPQASELARAEARVAQAQAQLELAQISRDEATLRAPFAGVVAAVNVAPGEQVSGQSPVTLLDVSRYMVTVTVDEVDIARVSLGQPVEVTIDALGGAPLEGAVRRIAPQPQSGDTVTAYEVMLEVDPGDRPVRTGMTASASIITDRRDAALSVPAQAVRVEDGTTVVRVVVSDADGEQQVVTRPVELGLRAGDRVEILSGLEEGDQVVVQS